MRKDYTFYQDTAMLLCLPECTAFLCWWLVNSCDSQCVTVFTREQVHIKINLLTV